MAEQALYGVTGPEEEAAKDVMFSSCQTGDIPRIMTILKTRDGAIYWRDSQGRTLLHLACWSQQFNVAEFLLGQGKLDVNAQSYNGETPLHAACLVGSLPLVQLLLEEDVGLQIVDAMGRTPFHYACSSGKLEIVNTLLSKGANPLDAGNNGLTPLHIAVTQGHVTMVKRLLQCQEVDVNAAGPEGNTPLHFACTRQNTEIICALIHRGASRMKPNDHFFSPSMIANPDILILMEEMTQS